MATHVGCRSSSQVSSVRRLFLARHIDHGGISTNAWLVLIAGACRRPSYCWGLPPIAFTYQQQQQQWPDDELIITLPYWHSPAATARKGRYSVSKY